MKVLVLAETRRGELRPSSLEVVSVGAKVADQTAGKLVVAVIDENPDAFVQELSVAGVDELILVRSASADFDPSQHRELAAAAAAESEAELVLTPMSVNSLGFVPALAATRGWGLATDVTAITTEGSLTAVRPEYAGKVDVELEFPGKETVLLSVREGLFERASGVGAPSVRALDAGPTEVAVEHVGYTTPEQDPGIDITGAELLLAVGRAIEDGNDLQEFADLAEAMGGTLAVSRPLVDAGWAPSARQVGQSGKTVRPKVYLAMGISGAVQHIAGIREAELVIAVNTDPEAPIFRVARYGAVADMFEVADELASQFAD